MTQFLPVLLRRVPLPTAKVAGRGHFSARKPRTKTKTTLLSGSNPFINCVGCGGQIHDQFILRVAPNLEWHAACLKCCECQMFLDENHTCFVREGKTYCKNDYVR